MVKSKLKYKLLSFICESFEEIKATKMPRLTERLTDRLFNKIS